jgi:hypothetical protein
MKALTLAVLAASWWLPLPDSGNNDSCSNRIVIGSFDTREECENARYAMLEKDRAEFRCIYCPEAK